MPRLKKRKDGRYRITIKGKSFYGKTEREAINKAFEYEKRKAEGPTFEEAAEDWWNVHSETLAAQSLKVYRPAMKRAIEHIGALKIRDIEPRDINKILRVMAAQNYAHKTISNTRLVINLILNDAIMRGDLSINPCTAVRLPQNTAKNRRTAATESDESKIFNTDHPWLFPLFALLSGLRKGEILALTWQDIDFENNTISVTKSVQHIGDKPSIKKPKTAAGVRTVPLLDALKVKIERLKGAPGDFIFSDDGMKPLTNRRYITLYDEYCRSVGISCTAHQLRHSYATIAVESGVEPKDLQTTLGHSSITTTMDIYAESRGKALNNVAERLNARYSQSEK